MALINCPECKKEVSDLAPYCPNCGVPIDGAKEKKAAGAKLTTIQETSKKFKIHYILSSLLVIIGFLLIFVPIGEFKERPEFWAIPIILMIIGLVCMVITRFRIWWHHK
jgi:uncharacterized membrane protein YvbJ